MFHFLHVAGYKALSFLVLPFLLSHGDPVPSPVPAHAATPYAVTAHNSAIPLRAPAVQSSCALTFSGPNPVSRNGWATYCINNWNGRCTTWYINGSYVTTYNGCLTINFVNGSPSGVSAVQHTDCTPSGGVVACGTIIFSFY